MADATKQQLKAQSMWAHAKLETARKANLVSLTNQASAMEAQAARQLAATKAELSSGGDDQLAEVNAKPVVNSRLASVYSAVSKSARVSSPPYSFTPMVIGVVPMVIPQPDSR